MAVQVVEAATVHEAVVHRLARLRAAGCNGLVDDLVDLFLAVEGQAGQDFRRLVRIRNVLLRELLELGMGQQDRREKARRAGVLVALLTAASLLAGAADAWWAARLGGRDRDQGVEFRLFRRR